MDLLFHPYGSVQLNQGALPAYNELLLPEAARFHTIQDFVEIQVETLSSPSFDITYTNIKTLSGCTIRNWLNLRNLTSLLVLKGACTINSKKSSAGILAGEYCLLKPTARSVDLTFNPVQTTSFLVTTCKRQKEHQRWNSIPGLKDWLRSSRQNHQNTTPKLARHTVLHAIREIFTEEYSTGIRKSFCDLKMEQSLFTQVADMFNPIEKTTASAAERALAFEIKTLIEKDLSKHLTIEDLSSRLNASESTLKRAFRVVYNRGIYEHLRQLRMNKAHEMLVKGALVKSVALSVGMRPTTFTTEFRNFYGYNASRLLK